MARTSAFGAPKMTRNIINKKRSNRDCVSQRWPLRQFGEKVVRPVKSVNISAMHGFNPVRSSANGDLHLFPAFKPFSAALECIAGTILWRGSGAHLISFDVKHACNSKQWHSQILPAHNWVIPCCKLLILACERSASCCDEIHMWPSHACLSISRNIYHFIVSLRLTFTHNRTKRTLFLSPMCILIISTNDARVCDFYWEWRTRDKVESQSVTRKNVQVKFFN